MSMFGKPIGFIHEGGTFGILFSGFVVVIAALNLMLDFDFIEAGCGSGRAEAHGVVRRLRAHRHAGVAVPRNPAAAEQAAEIALSNPGVLIRIAGESIWIRQLRRTPCIAEPFYQPRPCSPPLLA